MSRRVNPKDRMDYIARLVNGEYKISSRGVPYVYLKDLNASICYFARTRIHRIFHPFIKDNDQQRIDFKHPHEVARFIHLARTLS